VLSGICGSNLGGHKNLSVFLEQEKTNVENSITDEVGGEHIYGVVEVSEKNCHSKHN
jgi:hypothetical protein